MRGCLAPLLPVSLSVLIACGGGEEESAPAQPAAASPKAEETVASAKADETVGFKLGEENRSGLAGSATLKGGDRDFEVTLRLKRGRSFNPAHIHNVTCEEYRALKGFNEQLATVSRPLTDLEDGRSRSEVDEALAEYRTGEYSINVHSTEGGFPVVACGDIPTG